jgi:hypothetical protein
LRRQLLLLGRLVLEQVLSGFPQLRAPSLDVFLCAVRDADELVEETVDREEHPVDLRWRVALDLTSLGVPHRGESTDPLPKEESLIDRKY